MKDAAVGGTDPMWLAEATRVYPALKATYPGIPDALAIPPEAVRVRLAEALCHMVDSVSENGPILIGLDDIQHLDPASRDVLHLVARRWEAAPVLFLGTWRTAASQLRYDSNSLPVKWDRVLDIGPLENNQIARIMAAAAEGHAPDEGISNQIAALAQGNPYFAEMLLTDWRRHADGSFAAAVGKNSPLWEPPANMRSAFARLFEGMPAKARDALDVLAVAGRSLTNELRGCLGRSRDIVADTAWGRSFRAGWLWIQE